MNKKLPFLVVGYILGAFALVASISAIAYSRATMGDVVAAKTSADNCKGGP